MVAGLRCFDLKEVTLPLLANLFLSTFTKGFSFTFWLHCWLSDLWLLSYTSSCDIDIGAKLGGAGGALAPPLFCHPRGFALN